MGLSHIDKVELVQFPNKQWVKVIFTNGQEWIPKLEDIGIIANKIGICEDRKYNFPQNDVKGAELVAEYLVECIRNGYTDNDIHLLNQKFQIPK